MLKKRYLPVLAAVIAVVGPRMPIHAADVTVGLDVSAARPMAEGVIALGEQLRCIITYEDPPFQHRDDVVPVFPGSATLVPAGGLISYDYKRGLDAESAVSGLIARHAAEGNAGQFTVLKTNRIYNVVPTIYRNKSGERVFHHSILDTPISLSLVDKNCQFAFEALCLAVSHANPQYDLVPGRSPLNAFLQMPCPRERIVNEPARDVLNEILELYTRSFDHQADDLLTWQARFSPETTRGDAPSYVLLFRSIARSSPSAMKLRILDKRPMLAATRLLERRLGCRITYEDPAYKCDSDILGEKDLVGGIITMDWRPGDRAEAVLESLVDASIGPRSEPDTFIMSRSHGKYHVFPRTSKDERCRLMLRESLMQTAISIEPGSMSGADYLRSISNGIAQVSRKSIELGPVSPRLVARLSRPTVSRGIAERDARALLDEFLGEFCDGASWELLFDPGSQKYTLTVRAPE